MSPYLIEELYQQLKRVLSRPVALFDSNGNVYPNANDFSNLRHLALAEQPSRERSSLAIEGRPTLRAIPVYSEDRLLGYIVSELSIEDIQTLQVVTSLADLIVQQFLAVHKPRPDAIDLLLTRLVYRPSTLEEEELGQQMAALGYRLDVQRCAILFELAGFWDNYLQTIGQPLGEKQDLIAAKKRDISQSLISFFSKNQDNVIGYIGNDRFLVLKDLSGADFGRFSGLMVTHYGEITDILKNVYIKDVTAGIGSSASNPGDLIASVEEALQVLEVGQKLRGPNQAYRSDVLGVLPLVLSSHASQKREQAARILEGMNDPELEQTLASFLEHDLNLTKAAEALKVHRNTVIYRLDKITEILGKDPRSFTDAVELYLASQLRRIYP